MDILSESFHYAKTGSFAFIFWGYSANNFNEDCVRKNLHRFSPLHGPDREREPEQKPKLDLEEMDEVPLTILCSERRLLHHRVMRVSVRNVLWWVALQRRGEAPGTDQGSSFCVQLPTFATKTRVSPLNKKQKKGKQRERDRKRETDIAATSGEKPTKLIN